MKRLLVLILTYCLPVFCLTNVVKAAAGDLDATFGDGGKSITNFYGFHDTIYDAAVQPDGKTVVVGRVLLLSSK